MNLNLLSKSFACLSICAIVALLAGCASTADNSTSSSSKPDSTGKYASKYKADDGRNIEIGNSRTEEGGLSFKEPHMDKCWIADGFNFSGYDTLYIAPTLSTAKLHNDEEQRPHQLAKENIPIELQRILQTRGIFPNVVLQESEIKPGARVLKMENTIVEYAKGGGAARYFVGLYGGGQPILRVQGKMTDAQKAVFNYEARRSGVSAGARMTGAFMRDEDIQVQDIRSLTLDLADFMSAVSGKFQPR
jgi:hypothetical protein